MQSSYAYSLRLPRSTPSKLSWNHKIALVRNLLTLKKIKVRTKREVSESRSPANFEDNWLQIAKHYAAFNHSN